MKNLDYSSSLTQGLQVCLIGQPGIEFSNSRGLTLNGSYGSGVGLFGYEYLNYDTNYTLNWLDVGGFSGSISESSFLVVAVRDSDVSAGTDLANVFRIGAAGEYELNLGDGTSAGPDLNKARLESVQPVELFIDGIPQVGTDPSDTALTSGQYYTIVGRRDAGNTYTSFTLGGNGVNDNSPVRIAAFYYWDRKITDAELQALTVDPFVIFQSEDVFLIEDDSDVLSDSFSVSDSFEASISFNGLLSDNLSISDTVQASLIVNSSFSDEVSFNDSISSKATISVRKFNKVVSIKD